MKKVFLLLCILTTITGCSFTSFDPVDCENTQDCKEQFGWLATCDSDGFCHQAEIPNNCAVGMIPDDFYSNPMRNINRIPIGVIYDSIMSPAEFAAVQTAFWEEPDIDGHEFALLSCTNEQGLSGSENIRANVRFLAQDIGVLAIIGGFDSETTLIAFNELEIHELDTLLFSPTSMSPRIASVETDPTDDDPGQLWRMVPDVETFGKTMGNYILSEINENFDETEPANIVILYEFGQDGEAFLSSVENTIQNPDNIELVSEGFENVFGENERKEAIKNALIRGANLGNIDWLIVLSAQAPDYPKILYLTDSLQDFPEAEQYMSARFLFPPVAKSGTLARYTIRVDPNREHHLTIDENGTPNIVGIAPSLDTSRANEPYTSFANAYNAAQTSWTANQSAFAAQTYDTVWLTMYAAAWAYNNNGREFYGINGHSIRQGLRQLQNGESTYNVGIGDWSSAIQHLWTEETISLNGASGVLEFDLETEEILLPENGYQMELWGLYAIDTAECERGREEQHCIKTIEQLN